MKQLFLAFTIGFILCFLSFKTCKDSPPKYPVNELRQESKVAEAQGKYIEHAYKKAKENYLQQSDSLAKENIKLSALLTASKFLLRKQQLKMTQQLPCDTLRKEAQSLSELSIWQDSLCGQTIQSLNDGIAIRDSQLIVCDRSTAALFDLQKENQLREMKLNEDLKAALKTCRKKRFENRALTIGWMIMAGITTSLFIKTQQ